MSAPGITHFALWCTLPLLLGACTCRDMGLESESIAPCGPDGVGSPVPDDQTVPVFDSLERLDCALQGFLYEEIVATGAPDGRASGDTAPFALGAFMNAPVDRSYHAFFKYVDRCYIEVGDHDVRGERRLGRDLVLRVGDDDLTLRERKNWAPGETFYVYDPADQADIRGTRPGAALVLEGIPTGVTVPSAPELDAESYVSFRGTGVLDARWTPGDGASMIWVYLNLYSAQDGTATQAFCTLRDDGRAIIDLGVSHPSSVELNFGRVHHGIVQHPEFGLLDVLAQRLTRYVELDLDTTR